MDYIILIIGFLLIWFSSNVVKTLLTKNNWRIPLLELKYILKQNTFEDFPTKQKKVVIVSIFLVLLFGLGIYFILISTNLANINFQSLIIFFVVIYFSIKLFKNLFEYMLLYFSKKYWIKKIVLSPYFFAWRRDHLKEYDEIDIIKSINQMCSINLKNCNYSNIEEYFTLIAEENLRIGKTEYSKILSDNKNKADSLKYEIGL